MTKQYYRPVVNIPRAGFLKILLYTPALIKKPMKTLVALQTGIQDLFGLKTKSQISSQLCIGPDVSKAPFEEIKTFIESCQQIGQLENYLFRMRHRFNIDPRIKPLIEKRIQKIEKEGM